MNSILNISNSIQFDESVTDFEWHSHLPYSSNSFKNGDEIRIPVHQQDVYTLPSRSFLIVEGTIKKVSDNSDDATTSVVNNGACFLFDELRYELCGQEIDRIKNVGLTTTMKNVLTSRPGDSNWMANAGWNLPSLGDLEDKTKFSFCIPLKLCSGFIEDYQNILLNVKQELVLLRSSSDDNVIFQSSAALNPCKIDITKIIWKVPYVRVDDEVKLSLLKAVESDRPISLAFRRWQLYEYPSLPETTFLTWTVKTAAMMEKPRYVIVAFQTDRKNNGGKNASNFDLCSLQNIKLYLNSKYYPYDNLNGNKSLLYEMFSRFQSSYYVDGSDQPVISKKTFLEKTPMVVIDCSKQQDTLKSGTLDIRLEIQTSSAIAGKTTAYCLIIHDGLVHYSPLSGLVKKIM